MSRPRMAPLPDDWAVPMNTLVDAVRDAAVTDLPVSERVARQDLVPRARTGYKAPRLTRLAGMYAAAALRLQAKRSDPGERTVWDTAILTHLGADVITGWDLDQRLAAALALRATFKDLDDPELEQTATIRRLAAWLLQTLGPELPRVTARLCEHVLDTGAHTPALSSLWSAVHDPGYPRRPANRIATTAELAALPAQTLLVSTRPSYGPDYVLVYDAGDANLLYYAIADPQPIPAFLTASEVLHLLGPLEVVHLGRPAPVPVLTGEDPWRVVVGVP